MRILYATDLHGHKWKYDKIIKLSRKKDIDLIIIGADILPKHTGDIFDDQHEFICQFLPVFFKSISKPIIIDMGNDDLKFYHSIFTSLVDAFDHVNYSHMKEVVVNDVSFMGYNCVPDYPFGLKDWTRRDGRRISDPFQISHPVLSSNGHFEYIDNLDKYLKSKNSMDEDLALLPHPSKKKFIFLAHSPPRGLSLDICQDYRQVGSRAITNFIMHEKPIASLHGHIHESYYKSNIFYANLNQTICIQPGQSGGFKTLTYCEFDLDDINGTIKRKEVKK